MEITIKILKNITIFDNFIFARKKIFEYFAPNAPLVYLYYGYKNNIIRFKDNNIILFGNTTDKNKAFKLKYIYDYNQHLDNEIKFLLSNNINYMKEKVVFNDFIVDDTVSPIFINENDIIGYCFKYMENINLYNDYKCEKNIISLIQLSYYYLFIKNKISGNYGDYNKDFEKYYYFR